MTYREPKRPVQEYLETDEEFDERLEEYAKEMEAYEVACDQWVDELREREAEQRMGSEYAGGLEGDRSGPDID